MTSIISKAIVRTQSWFQLGLGLLAGVTIMGLVALLLLGDGRTTLVVAGAISAFMGTVLLSGELLRLAGQHLRRVLAGVVAVAATWAAFKLLEELMPPVLAAASALIGCGGVALIAAIGVEALHETRPKRKRTASQGRKIRPAAVNLALLFLLFGLFSQVLAAAD